MKKTNKKDIQSRGWVLTCPFGVLDKTLITKLKSFDLVVISEEISTDKKYHHNHIWIENEKTPIRFSALKKIFPKTDIEKRIGTKKQAYEYVTKTGKYENEHDEQQCEPLIYGDLNLSEPNQRTDLVKFKDAILSGLSKTALLESFPSEMAKYTNFYKTCLVESQNNKFGQKLRDNLRVFYNYGFDISSMTLDVINEHGFENVYLVDNLQYPFDDYINQDVIVFRNFNSNDFPVNQFIKYLDIFPLKLHCRFENKIACYTKVYILSHDSLDNQYMYCSIADRNEFRSKIHFVKKFVMKNEYRVEYDYLDRNSDLKPVSLTSSVQQNFVNGDDEIKMVVNANIQNTFPDDEFN